MFTFYQIRGIPDDFEVFSQLNSKYVSIIELKTTHKRKLTAAETRSSIFQLQLYIWILEPLLEPLGYKIAEEHTLEIRSQQDKHLIQKITVCPTLNMQEKLTFIFDCFRGLEKMSCPPIWVCQTCPKPIKEERGSYPHKNIERCIVDDVISEGGFIEAGLDFAYSPCKTVLYLTEKNGSRRKDIYHKAWAKKPIEDIAPEIAEILKKYNAVLVKADRHPVEYKGHIERYTNIPVYYIDGGMHKEAMIGQLRRRLLQKQIEIAQTSVDTIKQLRAHRRGMRTGDDVHDALILSLYEPKDPFYTKPSPCAYIDGHKIT